MNIQDNTGRGRQRWLERQYRKSLKTPPQPTGKDLRTRKRELERRLRRAKQTAYPSSALSNNTSAEEKWNE